MKRHSHPRGSSPPSPAQDPANGSKRKVSDNQAGKRESRYEGDLQTPPGTGLERWDNEGGNQNTSRVDEEK